MRALLLALLVATAACLGNGCAMTKASAGSDETAALSRAQIQAVVANPDRSDADRRNDVRRKPVEMLSFIGVRPGMVVLDVSAGGGYTTELLARVVGPTGRLRPDAAAAGAALAARLKTPAAARIVSVVQPFDNPVPPTSAPAASTSSR
jgi:predicted methyltransferase